MFFFLIELLRGVFKNVIPAAIGLSTCHWGLKTKHKNTLPLGFRVFLQTANHTPQVIMRHMFITDVLATDGQDISKETVLCSFPE